MIARSILYRGYARAIADAVEAWKEDHDDAMRARDLEDLVAQGLWFCDKIRADHQLAFEHLFAGKMLSTQEFGRVMRDLYPEAARVLEGLAQTASMARETGYEIERAGELLPLAEELRRLGQDFLRRWPLFDAQQLEDARAQMARGEFVSEEDIRRELDG